MKTRYTIKITEHTQETRTCGQNWERGADPDNGKEAYGYTPEIEKVQDVERTLYLQNTDDLDLTSVIKAVNGI